MVMTNLRASGFEALLFSAVVMIGSCSSSSSNGYQSGQGGSGHGGSGSVSSGIGGSTGDDGTGGSYPAGQGGSAAAGGSAGDDGTGSSYPAGQGGSAAAGGSAGGTPSAGGATGLGGTIRPSDGSTSDGSPAPDARVDTGPPGPPAVIDSVTFNDLTLAGYVSPRSPMDIPSSRWGVQLLNPASGQTYVDQIAGTGVKWVRLYMDSGTLRAGGSTLFDNLLKAVVALKIRPFITFATETTALATWEERLKTVVNRYKGLVNCWEVFNEPNFAMAATDYVPYVKGASVTIKSIDATAKIVGGSIALVDSTFVQQMLNAGAGPSMDALAFHPYADLPEYDKSFATTYPKLKSMLADATPPIPLWQGECGYPSAANSNGFKGKGPWSERIQAKWVTRRFLTDLGQNLPLSIYFTLRDFGTNTGPNSKGLLNLNTWTPKDAYHTVAYFTSIFDSRFDTPKTAGTTFTIAKPGSFTGSTASSIRVVTAGGAQGDVVTYWLPVGMKDTITAAQVRLTLSNANITDPVLVDLLDGRVFNIQVTTDASGTLVFPDLPLADYAFVIVSRAAVTIQPTAPKR